MCTLRQHHVNMKAEIWVLHLQAKDAKACQQATKARGEAKTDSPQCPQQKLTLTSLPWTSSLWDYETKHLNCLNYQLVVLSYGKPVTLTYCVISSRSLATFGPPVPLSIKQRHGQNIF